MRTANTLLVLVALSMSSIRLSAQTTSNLTSTVTNAAGATQSKNVSNRDQPGMTLRLMEPGDTNALDYTVSGNRVRLSGPAVRPLKAKSPSDFGARVLHLFSPFSDEQPNLPPGA